MKIQIHGAGFHNYGAWLMQDTVIDELSRRMPNHDLQFCATPGTSSNYAMLAENRLQTIFPTYRRNLYRRGVVWFINNVMPQNWRRLLGIVTPTEVDALIDVSGYAFGDFWSNTSGYEGTARLFSKLRARDKPVVMLPQMFGPFNDARVGRATRHLLAQVDHVYARDTDSLKAVKDIIQDQSRLSLAPDITIFAKGIPFQDRPPFACIVPNERMLDKGGKKWGKRYFELLTLAIRQTHEMGFDVVLLSHAPGDGDLGIAKKLAEQANSDRVEVLSNLTPRTAKGILTAAEFVVGSRFHALVAALSSAVPVVALGWAHKYPRLLADFGLSDHNFEADDNEHKLVELIEKCANQESSRLLRKTLCAKKKTMQPANEAMWQDLVQRLTLSSSRP